MDIELNTRPSLLLSRSECCGAKHIIVLFLMERSSGVRKGAWSKVEDDLLRACVEQYGEGKWHLVPMRAGLNRCRKSCRLRWLNYLEPNIKRGKFAEDEVDLMIRLHRLLGNRWSLIAGRLPGRTPNDVKNYWNTYIRRKASSSSPKEGTNVAKPPKETAVRPHEVIKPHPRTFSRTSPWLRTKFLGQAQEDQGGAKQCTAHASAAPSECNKSWSGQWWGTVLEDKGGNDAENDTCRLGEQDWKILGDVNNWDEVLAEDGDLLIEGQSWSDTLLDINLWDS